MLQVDRMTHIVLSSFVIILVTGCLADLQCDRDEVVKSCDGDCKLKICPKHENFDASCTATGSCAPNVCDCRFNYMRAENGTCIPAIYCPKFSCDRPNEEHVACSPLCPTDDCSQATPDGRCLLIGFALFVIECEPKCRCIKGYWRKNGICVPYGECPQFTDKKIS